MCKVVFVISSIILSIFVASACSKYVDRELLNRQYMGAEIRTKEEFLYGKFQAQIMGSPCAGTVVGFFTFHDNPNFIDTMWNEIDIEIMQHWEGIQTNVITHNNGHNPSWIGENVASPQNSFHTYAIEWKPSVLNFYVDNVLKRSITDPAILSNLVRAQRLYLNFWATNLPFASGSFASNCLPQSAKFKSVQVFKYNPYTSQIESTPYLSEQFKSAALDTSKWEVSNYKIWGDNLAAMHHSNIAIDAVNGVLSLKLTKVRWSNSQQVLVNPNFTQSYGWDSFAMVGGMSTFNPSAGVMNIQNSGSVGYSVQLTQTIPFLTNATSSFYQISSSITSNIDRTIEFALDSAHPEYRSADFFGVTPVQLLAGRKTYFSQCFVPPTEYANSRVVVNMGNINAITNPHTVDFDYINVVKIQPYVPLTASINSGREMIKYQLLNNSIPWVVTAENGAKWTTKFSSTGFQATTIQYGWGNWYSDLRLSQGGIQIIQGKIYRVSISAKTTLKTSRKVRFAVLNSDSQPAYGGWNYLPLTGTSKTFSFWFNATSSSVASVVVHAGSNTLGPSAAGVFISKISILMQ